MFTEVMSDYDDEINQRIDLLLRDNRKAAAVTRMEKQDQWISRLFRIDKEDQK